MSRRGLLEAGCHVGSSAGGAGGRALRRQAAERLEQTHAPVEAIHHVRRFIGVNFRSAHSACRAPAAVAALKICRSRQPRGRAPLRWHQPTDEARDNRRPRHFIIHRTLRGAHTLVSNNPDLAITCPD